MGQCCWCPVESAQQETKEGLCACVCVCVWCVMEWILQSFDNQHTRLGLTPGVRSGHQLPLLHLPHCGTATLTIFSSYCISIL